jgi:hypothetical protein
MARNKPPQADPALAIDFFISGYFTYRSQLFAPYKSIGINVVSFRDPVIDGANFENSDKLEWTRRPGFSKFCTVQLGAGEIVNQFYSWRLLNGTVVPFFDSTVQLATFSPTSITPIITKTTTAQGYPLTIGNMTYFSDGTSADMQKWGTPDEYVAATPVLSVWGLAAPTVTPTIANLGCWLPKTLYSSNSAILDPNGNVEVALITASGATSQTENSTTFGTVTLAGSNGNPWQNNLVPIPGQNYWEAQVNVHTYTNYAFVSGFGFSIPSTATILGVVVSLTKGSEDTNLNNYITDYSVKLCVSGTPTGIEHADTVTHWSQVTNQSQIGTNWGTATYGTSTDTWGLTLTPAQVNASTFGVAIAAQAPGPSGAYAILDIGPYPPIIQVYYLLPGGTPGIAKSGSIEPTWSTILNSPTQDGTIVWTNAGPLLIWFPVTTYPLPAVIVDPNGNLQIAVVATNPIEEYSATTAYIAGDEVVFGGTYWIALTASTGVSPANGYSKNTVSGSVTTVQPYWVNVPSPITTGTSAPVWGTTPGDQTTDGDYTWTNIGQGNLVESFGTSYVYGFRTIYGHLTTCSPVSLSTGSIFGPQSAGITAFSINGFNTVTFTGTNNFIPGNTFTVTGLQVGTYLNNQTFVVLAAGLTTTAFSAAFTHAPVATTQDTGTTQPLIATVSGFGTASPLCNATANVTAVGVIANVVTITAVNNFVPGLYVTFTGITSHANNLTWLNGLQLEIINVDPMGEWFQVYYETPNIPTTPIFGFFHGLATFNAVEIYRVSDGGGIYLFAGAVTNPGANLPWTYNDFTTDADLDILSIAPQNHLNDPPPGAPGSTIPTAGTILAFWQGRLWMVVGNYLYFDAGPDCENGLSHEAWPPANRFQFAGPIFAAVPTADGVGLLVYLADRVCAVLGGPETISFYPTDALSNFGITNPNAIFKDKSIIGQFTTQGQYIDLIELNDRETGHNVADYLQANFPPASTYVTMHRNGLDVGVFLSNGSNQILRFGPNVPSWSVPYYPVGGVGALKSIETSVGIFSLMMAPPTGGGYLLARNLNTWQDNGENYANCYVTVGNITMSQPGAELFPLRHVVGYFDAVGSLTGGGSSYPTISILPNEVSGTTGIGFIELPEALQEPPIGQTQPSTTLLALRWPVDMMNSQLASLFVHHLQCRIEFAPENAPNTLKSLAFKEHQNE